MSEREEHPAAGDELDPRSRAPELALCRAARALLQVPEGPGLLHAHGAAALHRALVAAALRGALRAAAQARGLTLTRGRLSELDLELEGALTALIPGPMQGLAEAASAAAPAAGDEEALGRLCERLCASTLVASSRTLALERSRERKRSGSFFTPRAITREVVALALAPLAEALSRLDDSERRRRLASLKVLDPAMGAGAFLLEGGRQLQALSAAPAAPAEQAETRRTAAGCLFGIDVSPLAAAVSEASLWLWVADAGYSLEDAGHNLAVTDSLEGDVEPSPGFDLVIGNPPWVAYAGRSAQPLARDQRRRFAARFRAWRGFPTLHGLFVERACELAPRGVIALLVPSPLSDLDGYRAVRAALTRTHRVREPLLELGEDAFEGVVQPCIALIADPTHDPAPSERPWVLRERQRLHGDAEPIVVPAVLRLLGEAAPLPPMTFRELGFQSTARVSQKLLRRAPDPSEEFSCPLLEGKDIREFQQGPPRLFLRADPELLRSARTRLRALESYREVGFVVRQTASFPIAARHCGLPFRNSLLAGFGSEDLPVDLLVALLNSALYRALHLAGQRDARQATFPQVKIAHLRRLPLPPPDPAARAAVGQIGARAAAAGIDAELRARLDEAVFSLWGVPVDHATQVSAFLARRAPSLGYRASASGAGSPLHAVAARIEAARARSNAMGTAEPAPA